MKMIKCDRCGKEVIASEPVSQYINGWSGKYVRASLVKWCVSSDYQDNVSEIDLCRECQASLNIIVENWIDNGPTDNTKK